jgi:DNA-directed RNA polymerase subunit M/transcription elongation factor TFIIS
MNFCPDCNNSLKIQQNDNTIDYRCIVCNYESPAPDMRYHFKDYGDQKCENYRIETYKSLCDDPTIPITTKVKCPDCKDTDSKVVFIKCDTTLNNIYICCKCHNYWYSD